MSAMPPSAARLAAAAIFIALISGAAAYTNHTVGGKNGWFFNVNTNTAATNYSAWAAKETFGLGDYLIFNTNTNQTVIQTYNATTYANCTADFASDNDTFVYDGGSTDFGSHATYSVPLAIVGPNYFFSDAGDGFDCGHGMSFEIDVVHGAGLPPSLNQPPPPPYTPGPAYEPHAVFQGSGGGQGADLSGCDKQINGGALFGAAMAALVGLVAL